MDHVPKKGGLALATRLREAGLLGYRKQRPALKVAVSSRSVPALRVECAADLGVQGRRQQRLRKTSESASPQFVDYNSG